MRKFYLFLLIISGLAPISVYALDMCSSIFASDTNQYVALKPGGSTDILLKERLGKIEEHTLRSGKTAAHIYMDTSVAENPYMFFAFPAGNSGVSVWFKPGKHNVNFSAINSPKAVTKNRRLNGASIDIKTNVKSLRVTDTVLGSMRFVRDRELNLSIPKEVQTPPAKHSENTLVFYRKSLNGLFDYLLELEAIGDTHLVQGPTGLEFSSPTEVKVQIRGYTSETPLTPMRPEDVFKDNVLKTADAKKLQAFMFLLYKEKLMAGAPRYHSKFGRDSIFTLNALMSDLKPEAIENLLTATLSSLDPASGRVSHEQHEGDFASYERMREGKPYKGIKENIEDIKMIDDDFAFAIVLAKYMRTYPTRVKTFLDGRDQRGLSKKELVDRNFEFVINKTAAFAQTPVFSNLIRLLDGEKTGQWRDSDNGLAGGRYPFDVNAALVPGALRALAEVYAARNSEYYNPNRAMQLASAYQVWNTKVTPLFTVRVPAKNLRAYGEAYFSNLGIDTRELPATPYEDLLFPAISLDDNGRPIRVLHSDDSLMMTFGYPSQQYLKTVSQRITYQFPYGLFTPVGILVANPMLASKEIQHQFDETKYHGRVSWAMQEDLLVMGIDRQLKRSDLSENLREDLLNSKEAIETVIKAKSKMGGTEVFSIIYKNGKYQAVPFAGDAKSNSNQLWSHLRIAK